MATIGTLAVNVVARTGDLQRGLQKGRAQVNTFSRSLASARAIVGGFGAAMGASFTFGQITKTIADIDKLAKTSAKLGIGTEALSGMHHAAELSGLAVNTVDMALQRMTRRLSEAAVGKGEALSALGELGLDAERLARLSPDQQLMEIADALVGVSSQGDRVRLAFKLFDSEGVAMVNMLKDGSAGLKAMLADAERLGLTVTQEQAKMAEAANDAMTRMKSSVKGLIQQLTTALAPAIKSAADGLSNLLSMQGALNTGGAGELTGNRFDKIFEGMDSAELTKTLNRLQNIRGDQRAKQAGDILGMSSFDIDFGALKPAMTRAWDRVVQERADAHQAAGLADPDADLRKRFEQFKATQNMFNTMSAMMGTAGKITSDGTLARAASERAAEADRIREAAKLPAEIAAEEIKRAIELMRSGDLDATSVDRLINQWDQQLLQPAAVERRNLGITSRESVEGARAAAGIGGQRDPIKQVAKASDEQVKLLSELVEQGKKEVAAVNVKTHSV